MTIRALRQAMFLLLLIGSFTPSIAFAAVTDYRFEIVAQPVKAGRDASFALQAIKVATGKPVAGLVVNEPKLHMVMGTMDMPSAVKSGVIDENGLAHFTGALTMYGEWTLDLTATLPEEKDALRTSVKFQVVK